MTPPVKIYNPGTMRPVKRVRPGRYIPQFLGMRVSHDDHRRRWGLIRSDYLHWTDCDACLAIAVYDQLKLDRVREYGWSAIAIFAWSMFWLLAPVAAFELLIR